VEGRTGGGLSNRYLAIVFIVSEHLVLTLATKLAENQPSACSDTVTTHMQKRTLPGPLTWYHGGYVACGGTVSEAGVQVQAENSPS